MENIWACNGSSDPYSNQSPVSKGSDQDVRRLSVLTSPAPMYPPSLLGPPPSTVLTDSGQLGPLPLDTKDIMSAALSNSMLWLKATESRHAGDCLNNSSNVSDIKTSESFTQPAFLLAQVHATLQALQANASSNNANTMASSEHQAAFERFTNNKLAEISPYLTPSTSFCNNAVNPTIGYYPATQYCNTMVRNTSVKLPMSSSQVMSDYEDTNSHVKPFLDCRPALNVNKRHWLDNMHTMEQQFNNPTHVMDKFYYNTPQSAVCLTGSNFTRSVLENIFTKYLL